MPNKRGPKRRAGPREASGRLSRAGNAVEARRKEAWDAAERDTIGVALDARQRLHGLSRDNARSQMAGSFIGRLRLQGNLTQPQYDALCAYEEVCRAFNAICVGPKGDSAFDPTRVTGMPAPENVRRSHAIEERYRAAHKAVMEKQYELRGFANLFGALHECVIRDHEIVNLTGDLRHAANALAKHFGTEGGRMVA